MLRGYKVYVRSGFPGRYAFGGKMGGGKSIDKKGMNETMDYTDYVHLFQDVKDPNDALVIALLRNV